MRKQPDKLLPSGVSPKVAYLFPERFNGRECLQPVDMGIIDGILADMEEQKNFLTDWDVSENFAARCNDVYATRYLLAITSAVSSCTKELKFSASVTLVYSNNEESTPLRTGFEGFD